VLGAKVTIAELQLCIIRGFLEEDYHSDDSMIRIIECHEFRRI